MVEALVEHEAPVVRPTHLRLLPPIEPRRGISRELVPSESLKWDPENPWNAQRKRVSLSTLEADLYVTSEGMDRARCDAEYKPELRAFERMVGAGLHHKADGYPRVVDAWHGLLLNPAVSDNELDRLAMRTGINEEAEKHMLTRTDI